MSLFRNPFKKNTSTVASTLGVSKKQSKDIAFLTAELEDLKDKKDHESKQRKHLLRVQINNLEYEAKKAKA